MKRFLRVPVLVMLSLFVWGGVVFAQNFPNDTPVYYGGGNRGHIAGCRRLSEEAKAAGPNTTYGDMIARGGQLCSRCPGSTLNVQREAATEVRREPRPPQRAPSGPAVQYDPNTTVYLDTLWFRAHAEDCPALVLREEKKTMTLEEADKAGYRIGVSGQSGRDNCCFTGYQRKYPQLELADTTILSGNDLERNVKHLPGCHRYWPDRTHRRRTQKEWVDDGFKVCPHCIERGPGFATISAEAWSRLGPPGDFVAPEGWAPAPFSPERLPPADELRILIQETLSQGNAIQELPYTDPVATVEQFMGMRFFFPVHQWLNLYMAYRSTGDRRVRETLLESARHYHNLSVQYPSAVQRKAIDPEGLAYMYSMAASARITLQLARKHPSQVTREEIAEAAAMLETMVSVLKPAYEGNEALDPVMGIPRAVADDFRERAFNRAMNGIGTLSMIAVALEDLQAIQNTRTYQVSIDRYRKVIGEYLKYWFSQGHFCSETKGFYYPYKPENGNPRMEDGHRIFGRPEDAGHYSHTLQGLVILYETMPELGVDDDFLTSIANAMHHNSTTKIRRGGKMVLSGHVECPVMSRVRPYGNNTGGHQYSPARERFYLLHAFRDDMIDGLCDPMSPQAKTQANSEYDKRIATLFGQYVKALRGDRSLVYLGER